jgi:hypothetical protein
MRTPLILTLALVSLASSSVPVRAQEFSLTDTKGLVPVGVTMAPADYLGRKVVRLIPEKGEGFALLPGVDFQDGTIEADVAVKVTTPAGVRNPGFIGIAFRAKPDATAFDMFYIRPGNSIAEDQAMRNHAVQYVAAPSFGWYELRRAWPFIYEAHAKIDREAWTHLKIVVAGRVARLYLNGDAQPTLIVDGMKGQNLRGGVALHGFSGGESYFSNVKVTAATPAPIKNGSDAAGTWQVKLGTDSGMFEGTLQLQRQGEALSGTWSGALGSNQPVTGTWRDGYVELSFPGEWPKEADNGKPGPVTTTLAGWIDGDAGKGRGKVEGRADGQWSATKKPSS